VPALPRLIKRRASRKSVKGAKGKGGASAGAAPESELAFDPGYLSFEYHAAIIAATGFLYPALALAKKTKARLSVSRMLYRWGMAVHWL
jgi:hypothetical protein